MNVLFLKMLENSACNKRYAVYKERNYLQL